MDFRASIAETINMSHPHHIVFFNKLGGHHLLMSFLSQHPAPMSLLEDCPEAGQIVFTICLKILGVALDL